MLDQFYWAERMFWVGVASEPLKRDHLIPDSCSEAGIRDAANALSRALNYALSPQVKARALEIAERISLEVKQFPWKFNLPLCCPLCVCVFLVLCMWILSRAYRLMSNSWGESILLSHAFGRD